MIEDNEYLESKKIYKLILENRPVKPRAHDAYIAAKKVEAVEKAFNDYKNYLVDMVINNSSLLASNIDELCNSLLDYSTNMADKLINGFWNYDYSDEESYSFNSFDEIIDSILRLHYHENSKNGLCMKISTINRLIVDNTKKIFLEESNEEAKEKLISFKESLENLFKEFNQ